MPRQCPDYIGLIGQEDKSKGHTPKVSCSTPAAIFLKVVEKALLGPSASILKSILFAHNVNES